jgi:plastocyanin
MRKTFSVIALPILASLSLFTWGCGEKKEERPAPAPAPSVQAEPAADKTGQPAATEGMGTISGKVVFKGKWTPAQLPVAKDGEVCGKSKQDPSLLVSNAGEVMNAVVYLPEVSNGKKIEPQKITFDQKGCEYHPHVLAFPAGSTVEILNPDGVLHNIHTYSEQNSPVNLAMPGFKKTLSVEFAKPEIISVKCDVHGWMSGWFFVAANPYFSVSDKSGEFRLAEVPSGDYTLEVWHEKLGKQTQKVTVKPGESAEVKFEFQQNPN